MPDRRVDDLVNDEGEPISLAHKAIYEYIGECKKEIIADRGRVSAEAVAAHVAEHHHPSLAELAHQQGKTPTELMEELMGAAQMNRRIIDALEGKEVQRLDGRVTRDKDTGLIFQVAEIREEMKDGVKHKAELTKAQWGVVTAAVISLGTIAAALVT